MRRLLVALFALALSLAPASAMALSEQTLAEIDTYLQAELTAGRIPGTALGIVQGDKVVFLKGYGKAGPGRAVTPQTPMILGSTSKSITALAVMQLAEAKKLDLDAPVQKYLPNFRTADAEASGRITVRHLLNQNGGLSRWDGRAALLDDGTESLEQLVAGLKESKPTYQPGEGYEYSNLNYDVLGLLVEKVSGQPFGAYLKANIFTPLQMTGSGTSKADVKELAEGYRMWFGFAAGADLPSPQNSLPSAYVIASAEDMTHYLIAQMGGAYAGKSVVSPAGLAAMHAPGAKIDADSAYGMGWVIEPMNGVPAVHHAGDVANFHSEIVMLPDTKTGFILVSNVNHMQSGQVLERTAYGIAAILSGQPAPELSWAQQNMWLIYGLVCLLVALPLAGMPFGWRRLAARLRKSGRWAWLRVGLSVTVNLTVAAVVWFGLPWFSGGPWGLAFLFVPDLTWLLAAVVAFNLIGAGARVWIALTTLRKQGDSWKQSSVKTTA